MAGTRQHEKLRYKMASSAKRKAARFALNPVKRKRKSTRGLNLNPLRKVMKEAGTRKVRVMRSKSGKPTGIKFL